MDASRFNCSIACSFSPPPRALPLLCRLVWWHYCSAAVDVCHGIPFVARQRPRAPRSTSKHEITRGSGVVVQMPVCGGRVVLFCHVARYTWLVKQHMCLMLVKCRCRNERAHIALCCDGGLTCQFYSLNYRFVFLSSSCQDSTHVPPCPYP